MNDLLALLLMVALAASLWIGGIYYLIWFAFNARANNSQLRTRDHD